MKKVYQLATAGQNKFDLSQLKYTMSAETQMKWLQEKAKRKETFKEELNKFLGEENIRKIMDKHLKVCL